MRQPDLPVCVDCHENAVFVWDEMEGTWLSECCHAPALPVDVEPWDDLDDVEWDDSDLDLEDL